MKTLIRRRYAARLADFDPGTDGRMPVADAGYAPVGLDRIPHALTGGWSGCGALADAVTIRPTDIVVDLGCGTGVDTWLIANAVTTPAAIIALDITREVLAGLRDAAQSSPPCPILPVAGDMEHLPLAQSCCDLVISNSAICLAIDQRKAFSEAFRILRPGGRLHAIDLVRETELPADILADPMGHGTSLGGVLRENALRDIIEDTGFENLFLGNHRPYPPVIAVEIRAQKPP